MAGTEGEEGREDPLCSAADGFQIWLVMTQNWASRIIISSRAVFQKELDCCSVQITFKQGQAGIITEESASPTPTLKILPQMPPCPSR